MLFVVFFVLIVVHLSVGEDLINCPPNQIHFEKIIGLRPPHRQHPLLLVKSDDLKPITSECLSKCRQNADCLSFVLYYNTSHCFWFKSSVGGFQEEDNVLDTNVAWFAKSCLKADQCQKQWVFERVPGAILIGNDAKILPNNITREECQQHCLDETSFACRSIKFRISQTKAKTIGTCVLSDTDRHLMPNSYRVSTYNEEYFENQCTKTTTNEFCAFEEFENATLYHVDQEFENKTKDECKSICEGTIEFNCRGFSLIRTSEPSIYSSNAYHRCLIHTEDSKVHGPKLLNEIKGAQYYEKAPCLNISVTCTDTYMTIKFQPEHKFNGKIYMQGYSERLECYALGRGKNLVQLKISLLRNQCGVSQANSNVNRTLLSSTMVLQYNSMIQTQSDRIIKVGCLYGNGSKVLIGTGVNFTVATPSPGTTTVQTNSELPHVELRIVDLNTQAEVSDTQIGEMLQLIIEMKPPTKAFDIWAGHLVAMTETGKESLILLDDQGCPTNLDVFPALTKTSDNSSIKLEATFQAFKFASSSIIRFSVIVQFCPIKCPIVNCQLSDDERRKRDIKSNLVDTTNGTTVAKINREDFDTTGKNVTKELPLEFIIVVRNSKIAPDRLIYGENNKILVAGYDYITNEFCINDSLLIAIIITWILVQIILIVSCIVLIRRYKRYYELESLRQSTEHLHKNFGIGFSNLDGRRVHFADHHGMSSFS